MRHDPETIRPRRVFRAAFVNQFAARPPPPAGKRSTAFPATEHFALFMRLQRNKRENSWIFYNAVLRDHKKLPRLHLLMIISTVESGPRKGPALFV